MSRQYIILGKIANSPIGDVFEGCDTNTQQKVSVLQMDSDLCQENFDANWEMILKTFRLKHALFEKVIDFDKSSHRIILPEREKTMQDIIREGGVRVRQKVVRAIIYDILELLDFFQQKGFIHGDIRPNTLLLSVSDMQPKKQHSKIRLAYSSGIYYGDEIIISSRDHKYLAPEMLNPKFGAVSPATDMYCLAFSALELLFGDEFNNLFQRIGPDGKPHWGALHGVGKERLPPLRSVFPGIDTDLFMFFHRVVLRNVARRPTSTRDILSRMKTIYMVQKLYRKIGRIRLDEGIVCMFREYFSKQDWIQLMLDEAGTTDLPDEARTRFIIQKSVSFLQSFAVPRNILDRVREMKLTFEKPDSYDLVVSTQSDIELVDEKNKTVREKKRVYINNGSVQEAELVSDLTGRTRDEIIQEDPSLLETFSKIVEKSFQKKKKSETSTNTVTFSITSKAWWDAQFKKKSVLYGLFGGIVLMMFVLLLLSPSGETTTTRNRIPDGCIPVSEKGIDPVTGLPRMIEVTKLRDVEPLRLVLVSLRQDSQDDAVVKKPRLGERASGKTMLPPFYIAEKEVSIVQFEYLINDTTVLKSEAEINKAKTGISHENAGKFCVQFGGQLPTEDQWECAADNLPAEKLPNIQGTIMQWCSERYTPDLGEERLIVSENDYLVKGTSPLMFFDPEKRSTWRIPANAEGAPDIGFKPVVVPLSGEKEGMSQ